MATKLITLLVRVACLLLVLSASGRVHAESRRTYGQTVVASLLEEPIEIDPLEVQTHTDLTMVGLLFDTLYQMRDGKLVPHLASAMPDVSEPLQVRIPLRAEVRFHDGRLLQSRDVAQSLVRLQASRFGYLLGSVKSVQHQPGLIVLSMKRADGELAMTLSDVHTSITAGGRPPTWRRLQASGAFRLRSRSAATKEVQLVANGTYFAGRSFIDKLQLRWYEDSATEARLYETGDSIMSLRGDIAFAGHRPKYRTLSVQGDPRILAFVGFGKQQAITSELAFRQAVSAAIGRNGMAQIGSGERVEPTLSVLPSVGRQRLGADLRAASRLIRSLAKRYPAIEAGTQTLELIVNTSRPDDAAIADRVAAALFHVGIRIKRVDLKAKTFLRRARSGQCDIYIGQLALEAPSKEDLIRAAFVAGRRDKALPLLSEASLSTLTTSFAAQLPIVPLFHRGIRLHFRSDLAGVDFTRGVRLRFEDVFMFGSPEKN